MARINLKPFLTLIALAAAAILLYIVFGVEPDVDERGQVSAIPTPEPVEEPQPIKESNVGEPTVDSGISDEQLTSAGEIVIEDEIPTAEQLLDWFIRERLGENDDVLRLRVVRIDTRPIIEAAQLIFDGRPEHMFDVTPFPGTNLHVRNNQVNRTDELERIHWFGFVDGDELSSVTLHVGRDGDVDGTIASRKHGVFVISPTYDSRYHVIYESNPDARSGIPID